MSVIFDQLRVSDNGKRLYINAHVNKADMFKDTTIVKLYICTGNQVYETLNIDPESNGYIYKKDYDNVKEINEVIEMDTEGLVYNKTSFSKDLFFVYVKCANLPDDDCCYTMVGDYVLNVTFDENLLYQRVMDYTKGLAEDCSIPTGFTAFILLWNAFKASVETEHYIPAIKYYNMLFGFDEKGNPYGPYGTAPGVTPKLCGCHG